VKIVLIRHGRPDEGNAERPQDPPLHKEGWRQALAVAKVLAGEGITRVASSPLLRAQQTAEPLSQRLGLPIETIDAWAEADRHRDRYCSVETLRARGEAEWQRFLDDPVGYMGADPVAFRATVSGALDRMLAESGPSAHVAVFTHGLPINIVLSRVLGLKGITHFQPGYGSITRLRARGVERIGIISINESGHYSWPDDPLEPLRPDPR
jgi:broad specificity phosphatase PhoE